MPYTIPLTARGWPTGLTLLVQLRQTDHTTLVGSPITLAEVVPGDYTGVSGPIPDGTTVEVYGYTGTYPGTAKFCDLANDSKASQVSAPAAAVVASAVRTELTTELGRLDVATGTRLATAGYTAPPNTGAISTALAPSFAAIPAAPTVVQIRQEMDANSEKFAGIVAALATINQVLTDLDVSADVFDYPIEEGVSFRQALRAISAVLASPIGGLGTGINSFPAIGNPGTPRVQATDNRENVTLSLGA